MGDVTLYQSLLLDPDWVHDYNRVYTDFYKAHFTYMFEQVGLPDGIWIYEDLGYKNGLFASPKVLGEVIFPYYAELNRLFPRATTCRWSCTPAAAPRRRCR